MPVNPPMKNTEAPAQSSVVALTQEQLMDIIRAAATQNQGGGFSPEFTKLIEEKTRQELDEKQAKKDADRKFSENMARMALAEMERTKYVQRTCSHRKQFGQTRVTGQKIGENDELMLFICQYCQREWKGPLIGPFVDEDGGHLDQALFPPDPASVGR